MEVQDLSPNPASEPVNTTVPAPARTGWTGWSFVAGCVLAVPCGVLLAYLAALPFMLGLFFFLLLGLIIAATMFRVGSKLRPPGTFGAVASAVGITVVVMGVSLWVEYKALPRSVERVVRHSYYESFTADRLTKLNEETDKFVVGALAQKSPPGGFVGYLRWAAIDGTFDCPRVFVDKTEPYQLPYRRALWLIRLATSSLLDWWTVVSQTLALRVKAQPQTSATPQAEATDPKEPPAA